MLKIMISSCTLHSVQLCCYTFIAKQKMYRLWHSTWYIPPGHCLYYHRHYHLHQFIQSKLSLRPLSQATSSTELRPLFRIFLRELRLCSFCSGPFTGSEKQYHNRHVIFVTSFSSERRIELTHVIFRLQRVDQN